MLINMETQVNSVMRSEGRLGLPTLCLTPTGSSTGIDTHISTNVELLPKLPTELVHLKINMI